MLTSFPQPWQSQPCGDRAIVCRLQSGLTAGLRPCPGIASRLRPNWAIGRLISDIIIVIYGVADSPSLPVSRNFCRFTPLESREGTILTAALLHNECFYPILR
jgi:hypothetical protein